MRNSLCISLFFLISFSCLGQQKIHWVSWEEVTTKSQDNPKKLLVYMYSDWCKWCKKMEMNTYQNIWISEYLNEYFYAVKFDIETKEDIVYQGKTYSFKNNMISRSYHELFPELSESRKLPAVVFIDENGQKLQTIPGYHNASTFEMIIRYFAEDGYKTTMWNQYVDRFQSMRVIENKSQNKSPSHTKFASNKNKR